jgi:hypothetical protein
MALQRAALRGHEAAIMLLLENNDLKDEHVAAAQLLLKKCPERVMKDRYIDKLLL